MISETNSQEDMITTAIAIDRDKNSQYAVKWAIEKFMKNYSQVILVHVKTQQSSQPHEVIPKEGRSPTRLELQQLFLPFRGFCARKGVISKEMILHNTDIATALVDFINNFSITTIVLGASRRSALTRAFRNVDVSTILSKSAPDFCSVYTASKTKINNVRSATQPPTPTSISSCDDTKTPFSQGSVSSGGSEGKSFERMGYDWSNDCVHPLPPNNNRNIVSGKNKISSPNQSLAHVNIRGRAKVNHDYSTDSSGFSGPLSFQSSDMSFENLDHLSTSDGSYSSSSVSYQTPSELEDEMRRLRHELKHSMELYDSACKETLTARHKVKDVDHWNSMEAHDKLLETKQSQEAAMAMVTMEKQKCRAAIEAVQMAQRLADLESQKRKFAEMKAEQATKEKNEVMDVLARSSIQYRRYTIDEIEVVTDYFSSSAKIGEGGYGPVFKAFMDHTAVAIKVLRPDLSQGQKQFQREVDVLSCMRHPNMVLLLGACPEYGCLVYEYMENGSLEDRLYCQNGTPPMSWQLRFRIAAEIATALHFLHKTKPEPLVHRDLKPANILLNQNFVSKISDVGLARLVPPAVANSVTQYHMTAAAGTFCYIDPEYQQTGMLSTKSDIYSLGVMLLQIITARPPIGLRHRVSRAIERGTFSEVLDPAVTDWPVDEAMSFAKLALQCSELRKKERPDLGTVVLPELNRLREFGSENKTISQDTYTVNPDGSTSEVTSS